MLTKLCRKFSTKICLNIHAFKKAKIIKDMASSLLKAYVKVGNYLLHCNFNTLNTLHEVSLNCQFYTNGENIVYVQKRF